MLPDKPYIESEGSPQKWWTLLTVGLSVFMSTLDMSIVNVSLPTLVQELHTNFATIQWVILSYAVVNTSLILGAARLGDIYGKKKLYIIGLVLFTLSSLFCGLSPTVHWLIASRATQGIGSVMLQAMGMAIVTEVFPGHERGRAMGFMGSIVSVGLAMGPALGGMIIGLAGWHWIFLINVPIGLFAVIIAIRNIPDLRPAETGQRFDFAGAITLFITLAAYALAMTWGQARGFIQFEIMALIAVAVIGLIVFLFSMKHVRQPMLDPNLFKNGIFSLNLAMAFLVFVTLSSFFIIPFYLELVRQFPPMQVGLMMMPVPLSMGLIAPISGSLSDRYGSRWISIIGLVVVVCGCLLMSTLQVDTGVPGYLLRVLPLGIGIGLFSSPNMSSIMGAAPRHRLGVASGLIALARTLGQTSGLPMIGALFSFFVAMGAAGIQSDVTLASPEQLVNGIHYTYRIAVIGVLLSLGLAIWALLLDRHHKAHQTAEMRPAA